jgi:plastocyanin
MRKVLFSVAGLAVALLVFAAASDGENASANLQQATVSIGDNFYNPETVTVNAGTTVTWTNNGILNHTVTSDTGVFDSGIATEDLIGSGETFTFTFTTPGTYPYYCYLHGAAGGIGQAGTVVVQQVSTPTPTATAAPTTTGSPTVQPSPGATQSPSATATQRPAAAPASGMGGDSGGSSVLPWVLIGFAVTLLSASVVVKQRTTR